MGGEMGSIRKDVADLRIALAFPMFTRWE